MITILFFVIATAQGVTMTSQEFNSDQACEAAKITIREKIADSKVLLLTCTVK